MASTIAFLFGAGASKGALHIDPYGPPLGNEVYDKLADYSPTDWGTGSKLGQYREKFRHNFEQTLFNEVCPWNPSLSILEWLRPMALYFSRFAPDRTGDDLYSRLLLCLQAKGLIRNFTFGSLNYDCIFEKAAHRLGLKINYAGGKNKDNEIPVLKIHGSSNFVTEDLESKRPYLSSPGSYTESQIVYLTLADLQTKLQSKFIESISYHYPVISLYSFGKNTIVGGMTIQQIRETWLEEVSNTSLLVIIGVKPNEEDSHIWNPVRETSARLLYIGSQSDFAGWLSANSRFEHLANTFELGFDMLIKSLDSS